jgi:hypothetical protein
MLAWNSTWCPIRLLGSAAALQALEPVRNDPGAMIAGF